MSRVAWTTDNNENNLRTNGSLIVEPDKASAEAALREYWSNQLDDGERVEIESLNCDEWVKVPARDFSLATLIDNLDGLTEDELTIRHPGSHPGNSAYVWIEPYIEVLGAIIVKS